tara:strand:+ start:267 stop:536 length:270 start_codon:yes stop_codon:yes gene_type:complete
MNKKYTPLDDFYDHIKIITKATTDLNMEAKTIVLFRAALELGAEEMGVEKAMNVLARLMTSTMSILDGDEEADFQDILEDLDISDMTKN